MSIEMFVEIDDRLVPEELVGVFRSLGVETFVGEAYGYSGQFPESNMQFDVFQEGKSALGSKVIAEGAGEENRWVINTRIKFRYSNANFDLCSADMKEFIEKLANRTAANFLLSFQFEKVYVVRDHTGLHLLGDY
jgi:hypothetical protein